MAKQKRTALDRQLSSALKNTRNKVYRLRKKGASDATVQAFDPRTNGGRTQQYYEQWRRGKLTGSQKRAFLRQLQAFNAERVDYRTISKQGDFLPVEKVAEFYDVLRQSNREAARLRRNATRRNGGKEARFYSESYPEGKPIRELDEFDAKKAWRNIWPVERKKPFPNERALERAITAARERLESLQNYDERMQHWHEVAVNKLRANGQDERADAVQALTPIEFANLAQLTDFNALMEAYQYPEDTDTGMMILRDDAKENRAGVGIDRNIKAIAGNDIADRAAMVRAAREANEQAR